MKTEAEISNARERFAGFLDRVNSFAAAKTEQGDGCAFMNPFRLQQLQTAMGIAEYAVATLSWVLDTDFIGRPMSEVSKFERPGNLVTQDEFLAQCEELVNMLYADDKEAREYLSGGKHSKIKGSRDIRG